MAIRLPVAMLFLAFLAAQASGANYTADFNSATLDTGLSAVTLGGGGLVSGVAAPWSIASGGGYLTIAKSITNTPNNDVIGVDTNFAIAGSFVATVTVDWSGNTNGWGGFYMGSNAGASGFGFGTNGLWDSVFGFPGGGDSGVAPTPVMTFQISRTGNTLTKSYKRDGDSSFTVLSSLTGNMVLGNAYIELDNSSNIEPGTSLRFSNFSVQTPVPEPEEYSLLLAGLGGLALARRRLRRQARPA